MDYSKLDQSKLIELQKEAATRAAELEADDDKKKKKKKKKKKSKRKAAKKKMQQLKVNRILMTMQVDYIENYCRHHLHTTLLLWRCIECLVLSCCLADLFFFLF